MSNPLHSLVDKDGFRLRGTEMTRVDAFSDVVFGFALTLLVVSLEVPKTYAELHAMLMGFVPFAICFFFLITVWMEHYQFFRRFGLEDSPTIWINALLLFFILFYVYPLKFLFTMVAGQVMHAKTGEVFSDPMQIRELMVLYGVGFFCVYGLLTLLYVQGWRHRHGLGLNRHEEILTSSYIWDMALTGGVGLLSCAVAFALPPAQAGYAGLAYLLIAVHKRVHGVHFDRKVKRLNDAYHDAEAAE